MTDKMILPARLNKQDGNERRVGIELEFARLDMQAVAGVISKSLDGKIIPETRAECYVDVTKFGKFRVELDWQFAKDTARERAAFQEEDVVMEWLTAIASQIVPVEVVSPPFPLSSLPELEPMVDGLRSAGAEGTDRSPLYAFGMHVNIELPELATPVIVAYLQSYCIAQSWLLDRHDVDLTRRITPYIDLYPTDYCRRVLSYPDDINQSDVISDYLRWNPTRNRALDMMPMFKHLSETQVTRAVKDPRINARPALHYRMPNCEIEQTDWSLTGVWNIWSVVEALADDDVERANLAGQFQDYHAKLINRLDDPPWYPILDQLSTA